VFDKTGTLTLGTPRLIPDEVDAATLAAAARLARASRHPLSRALAAAAGPGPVASGICEQPGAGLEGEIGGALCRLGSASWTGADTDPGAAGGMALWFRQGESAPVCLRFEDDIQDGAAAIVRDLSQRGLTVEIVSGDRPGPVADVAGKLGITSWTAGASPQDKADRLKKLQAGGRRVLMVGDGLNDAGALALAHASAAPGGALDISQSAADAVYSGGLAPLPHLIGTARQARRIMLQNFAFAAVYNVVAVPIAVMGYATPLVAAIAMSASSVVVCVNALRLSGPKEKKA